MVWARALKAERKYIERMLRAAERQQQQQAEADAPPPTPAPKFLSDSDDEEDTVVSSDCGDDEAQQADTADAELHKYGELRSYPYKGGTLLGHDHVASEERHSAWSVFVPTTTSGEGGDNEEAVGIGRFCSCEKTAWTSWAQAARHRGSGVSKEEAVLRDAKHPLKPNGSLYFWRLDAASVRRLASPIRIQRSFSATPGPVPLHVTAEVLVTELAGLAAAAVLCVAPFKLSAKRTAEQQPPAHHEALTLRASQREAEAEGSECESSSECEGSEGEGSEGEGSEGEGSECEGSEGEGSEGVVGSVWTPVQRKGEYRAAVRAQQVWNRTHTHKRPLPKRTVARRRRDLGVETERERRNE